MKSHEIVRNPHFVGRKAERVKLAKVRASDEAHIVVIYGRRRVGKTELIEQFSSIPTATLGRTSRMKWRVR